VQYALFARLRGGRLNANGCHSQRKQYHKNVHHPMKRAAKTVQVANMTNADMEVVVRGLDGV
jgi:hypothetical protein